MRDRSGRDDRRHLHQLDEQRAELEAAQQDRLDWLEAHAETFAYRHQIAEQVAVRRGVMGVAASVEPPDHLVELLGPVPDDDQGRAQWTQLATRVEAYREEWGIEPAQLREAPRDAVQYREWDTAVKTIDLINRLRTPRIDRGLERGLGIEL